MYIHILALPISLALYSQNTPFYFMVFEWVASSKAFSPHTWAYDFCTTNSQSCRFIEMYGYFSLVDQAGIDAIVNLVNTIRKDFQGERLTINPAYAIYGEWKWWKSVLIPLRYVHRPKDLAFAVVGSLFMTLARSHNFPFDTIAYTPSACIRMMYPVRCKLIPCDNDRGLSLDSYSHTSTIMTSQLPSPASWNLPSMRMPVISAAAVVLLALTLVTLFLFKTSFKRSDLVHAFLLSMSPFCLQGTSGKGTIIRLFHISWLLFGTFHRSQLCYIAFKLRRGT